MKKSLWCFLALTISVSMYASEKQGKGWLDTVVGWFSSAQPVDEYIPHTYPDQPYQSQSFLHIPEGGGIQGPDLQSKVFWGKHVYEDKILKSYISRDREFSGSFIIEVPADVRSKDIQGKRFLELMNPTIKYEDVMDIGGQKFPVKTPSYVLQYHKESRLGQPLVTYLFTFPSNYKSDRATNPAYLRKIQESLLDKFKEGNWDKSTGAL